MKVIVDDKKARDFLTAIAAKAAKPREAMKEVSILMQRNVFEHFDKSEGADGKKWADLKPATWEQKLKKGKTNILINSGNLRRGNMPKSTDTAAIVEQQFNYGAVHQYGTKNVPARPFLWLSKNALNGIVKYMAAYLVRRGAV